MVYSGYLPLSLLYCGHSSLVGKAFDCYAAMILAVHESCMHPTISLN